MLPVVVVGSSVGAGGGECSASGVGTCFRFREERSVLLFMFAFLRGTAAGTLFSRLVYIFVPKIGVKKIIRFILFMKYGSAFFVVVRKMYE